MKKILYIHVGPPKTGSTAIQHFLCSNDQLLSSKGVRYIKALRDPLASILIYKYHGLYNVGDSKQYVDCQAELLKEFVDEISGISEGSIILSAGCLVNLGPEGVSEIVKLS